MLDQRLRQGIVFLFHLLMFAIPFLWVRHTFELFEYPKMMATYTLTVAIMSLWIARMIVAKRLLIRRSFWDVPLLLFLLSQIISTVLSIDHHTSVFGYYSRFHGGLLSTIAYLCLYYAAISNLTKEDVKKLLVTIVVTATLTSVYSFGEHFGHSPSCLLIGRGFTADCWIQDVQNRVFGTFGQPNWQAAYIITVMFIPLALFISKSLSKTLPEVTATKQLKRATSDERRVNFFDSLPVTRYPLLIIFSLLFSVLLFTKSRSGLLGFGLGYSLFWFLALTIRNNLDKPDTLSKSGLSSRTSRASVKSSTVSGSSLFKHLTITTISLLLLFLFFGKGVSAPTDKLFNLIMHHETRVSNSEPQTPNSELPSPTEDFSPGGTESGDIRKIVWKGAIKLWQHYPFFGSGVETFAYGYYLVRPVEHNLVSEWDFLYNKAHNEFLNFLSTTGAFGLLTYLLLILSYTVWTLKTLYLTKTSKIEGAELHSAPQIQFLLTSLLSGYLALAVSNFFGFATVSVATLFFLFPALSWLLVQKEQDNQPPTKELKLDWTQGVSLLFLLLASYFLLLSLSRMYRADVLFARGKAGTDAGELSQPLHDLAQASVLIPSEAKYAEELSVSAALAAVRLLESGQATAAAQLGQQAAAISDQTLQLNPVHLNHYKSRARVFTSLSTLDPAYLTVAIQALESATKLARTEAKVWYNLGLLYQEIGETEKALEVYEHTIELKANYEQARLSAAQLYEQAEQPDKALEQYGYILEFIAPNNQTVKEKLEALTVE